MTEQSPNPMVVSPAGGDGDDAGLLELLRPLAEHVKLLILAPLLIGLMALGATYLVKPVYTARTSFLPPQQQQSSALNALASLGAIGGLAGGLTGVRSPIEQYVSLLQSKSVADRIIDAFDLTRVYDNKLRSDTHDRLNRNVRIAAGRRDGLISIEVDDHDPERAAAMANRYVTELRRMTNELALTEAQQRRAFFEQHMETTRDRLARAQQALETGGFSTGALKAEPRAAAERYAKLQAEATAAEVRLQTLRRALVDTAPEVQQQLTQLAALRAQLARVESPAAATNGPDYVGNYREFKYQETLFELFARQYELARLDESREGALIQVIDAAQPPDRKSWPKRAVTAVAATLGSAVLLAIGLLARRAVRSGTAHAG